MMHPLQQHWKTYAGVTTCVLVLQWGLQPPRANPGSVTLPSVRLGAQAPLQNVIFLQDLQEQILEAQKQEAIQDAEIGKLLDKFRVPR